MAQRQQRETIDRLTAGERRVKYVSLDAYRTAAATPSGLDALAVSVGTKADQLAVRAAFPVEVVKETDPAAPVSFVISTESPDRDRDSIKVDGWDLNAYRQSPTVLFAHDYASLPIGRAPGIHVEDGKLKSGPITFVPAEVYPFAETCRQMVRLGFLNAASVGFRPLKSAFNEERRGMDFERQELLEFSIVPVPANAECLVEARSAGVDVELLREWAVKTLERFGERPIADAKFILDVPAVAALVVEGLRDEVRRTYSYGPSQANTINGVSWNFDVAKGTIETKPEMVHPDEHGSCPAGYEMGGDGMCHEKAAGESDKIADPLRWNRQLSKAFDVATERIEPASLEYAWVGRYLDAEIKDVKQGGTSVPSARMGSFLSALNDVLSGWTIDAIRNMTRGGAEAPPYYETIKLNSAKSREFLVDGIRFARRHDGARAVIKVEPQWWGLDVTTYAVRNQAEAVGDLIRLTWDRAKQLNFLKGEAFSLGGEFLTRAGEGWDDLFLDEKTLAPLRRASALLAEKGATLDSRGILLMGPPGTGKTLAGRVLMNQTPGATFLWLAARDFYRSGAFGGLADAFDLAEECAPTILFIEDVDSWLDDYAVDLLKTEMDGIKRRSGVVTILTTNYPHRLSEALIDRPGRFHDVLNLSLPTETVRQAMLAAWLPDLDAVEREAIAVATTGFSGAHLRELAKFARTLREESPDLTVEQAVHQALAKLREQRTLIDHVRQRTRQYVPSRAVRSAIEVAARSARPVTKAIAVRGAPDGELTFDVDDDIIDIEAIPFDDEDALAGLSAADVLAALREGIHAEATTGVRRAVNAALGRVD